jgi:hypothetical protein
MEVENRNSRVGEEETTCSSLHMEGIIGLDIHPYGRDEHASVIRLHMRHGETLLREVSSWYSYMHVFTQKDEERRLG